MPKESSKQTFNSLDEINCLDLRDVAEGAEDDASDNMGDLNPNGYYNKASASSRQIACQGLGCKVKICARITAPEIRGQPDMAKSRKPTNGRILGYDPANETVVFSATGKCALA